METFIPKKTRDMNYLLELIHNSLQNRLMTASFLLPQLFRAHCDPLSAAFSLFQRHRLNTPPPKICQGKAFLKTHNFNGNIRQQITQENCFKRSIKITDYTTKSVKSLV